MLLVLLNNYKEKNINYFKDLSVISFKPQALNKFSKIILRSNTILWNGPVGVFEIPNFQNGTKQIASAIAKATECGAFSLVGGGDSISAIKLLLKGVLENIKKENLLKF